MPSSQYQAWTVTAGEIPTTAQWNLLGSNDQSFNTGVGFNDSILLARHFANSVSPVTRYARMFTNFCVPGTGLWSQVTGSNGAMTQLIAYVNGFEVIVSAIASHSFTASKDTYIDVDYQGNVNYLPVTNGTAAPALTSNSVRMAIVVTDASNITNVYQTPQLYNASVGSPVFTGFDSIGNRIYPTRPDARLLGQVAQNTSVGVTIPSTAGLVSGFPTLTFLADGYHQVEVELYIPDLFWSDPHYITLILVDSILGHGFGLACSLGPATGAANSDFPFIVKGKFTPSAGSHTISVYANNGTAGTLSATLSGGRVDWSPITLTAKVVD